MKSHFFLFMTKDIKIFENPEFGQVRIVLDNENEPLFCLNDVCKILELQASAVLRRLDKDVISSHTLMTNGGNQQFTFVNEEGFYSVVLGSRKENVKPFKKWVTGEVLPSIRKTGSYSVKPMTAIEMLAIQAQAMVELEKKQLLLESQQHLQSKDIEYLKTKAIHRPDYYSIVGFSNKVKVKVGLEKAKKLGKICVNLCKQKGYTTEKIDDPRFGYIRTYPHNVLEEVFAKEFNLNFD